MVREVVYTYRDSNVNTVSGNGKKCLQKRNGLYRLTSIMRAEGEQLREKLCARVPTSQWCNFRQSDIP